MEKTLNLFYILTNLSVCQLHRGWSYDGKPMVGVADHNEASPEGRQETRLFFGYISTIETTRRSRETGSQCTADCGRTLFL